MQSLSSKISRRRRDRLATVLTAINSDRCWLRSGSGIPDSEYHLSGKALAGPEGSHHLRRGEAFDYGSHTSVRMRKEAWEGLEQM